MHRFRLPDIGEGVVEAEVIEWRVAEGETVAEDQPLVELMTDKANFEIPSPCAGTIHRLCFAVGDIVPVGAVLVEIDDGAGDAKGTSPAATPDGAKPPATPAPAPAARSAPETRPSPPSVTPRPAVPSADGGPRAVPAVRDLARRLGVDIERVAGSGPGGRVMRRDVELACDGATTTATSARAPAPSAPADDPPDWRRVPLRGLRRAIARNMARSHERVVPFGYVEEVDLTELLAFAAHLAHARPAVGALSPLAFIARAVVRALAEHPELNASLDDARDELVLKGRVHLGVAARTDDGLVVPVVRDATDLDTVEMARRIGELGERACGGTLARDALVGGTFTLTSLGKLGGLLTLPVVNHPEVAILGVGAIRRLPRCVGHEVEPRQVVHLSACIDHRAADGEAGARFVERVKHTLEHVDFPDLRSGPEDPRGTHP